MAISRSAGSVRCTPATRSAVVAAWLFGALSLGRLTHHYVTAGRQPAKPISVGSPAVKPMPLGRARAGTVVKATIAASYPQPVQQPQRPAQPAQPAPPAPEQAAGGFFGRLVMDAVVSACTAVAVAVGMQQASPTGSRPAVPAAEAMPDFVANSFVPNGTFQKREGASGSGSMAAGAALPDFAVAAVEMADDMAKAIDSWTEYSNGFDSIQQTVDAMVEEANRNVTEVPAQAFADMWNAVDAKVQEATCAASELPGWLLANTGADAFKATNTGVDAFTEDQRELRALLMSAPVTRSFC